MAPSPEYDKEPKAPDKSATNISSEDSKQLHNLVNDQHHSSDHKTTTTAANSEVENNKHVETLDDDKLRALLNEALTYKCPKDREGKSSLFKELLEEVEQDDQQACEAAARTLTGCRGSRRGARGAGRPALPHSNSLQDLVAALAAEPAHHARRHRHQAAGAHHHAAGAASTVAARAHHGGSLPSGVDTSSMLSEDSGGGSRGGTGGAAGYLATVRCVNPPPLAERRVSASDANPPIDELLNRRSKPMFPMTYTARATLEIGSGSSVCSGRAVTTTTASNQVDTAIPFSCITTPEVVASCNTTPSAAHNSHAAALPADPKPQGEGAAASLAPAPAPPPSAARLDPPEEQPRSVVASSLNGLPLARPGYGATPTTSGDDYKVPTHTIVPLLPSFVKSLDENGNSVQGYGSPLSGSSQHKKPRRKRSTKNETEIDCRQLDGYQGHKDVNELLRFIESDGAPKLRKHKDDSDDKGKKRSADRRKHHEHKPARASSLEELSRTTLEELTARAPPAKPERRSWGDTAPAAPADPPPPAEQADFQTVTKKRKPRRRTEEAAPRRTRAPSPRPADSAPPSDRSNDSNDDMDSVHSLPERAPPAPGAVPPPHHASYADIARTRHNIPDLIESCNFYAEGEGARRRAEPAAPRAPDPPPDADGYPALDGRAEPAPAAPAPRRAPRDKPSPPAARRKERPPPAAAPAPPADCPAPDVVSDRRPPVILLDSASRPRDMDGVTFGFDINEQLLGGGARRPRCDLVRDAVEAQPAPAPAPMTNPGAGAGGVPVRAAKRALRYVPPPPPPDHTQLHQIVNFVGGAWEDVVRCGGGKVRYFSETR